MLIPINNQLIPSLTNNLESLSKITQELARERELPTTNPGAFSRRLGEEIFKNLEPRSIKTQQEKDSFTQSLHGIIGHYTDWSKTQDYFETTVNLIVSKVSRIEEDLRIIARASKNAFSGYEQALEKFVNQSKRYFLDHRHRESKNNRIDKSNKFKWNLFQALDSERKPLPMNNGYNPSNPKTRTYNGDVTIPIYSS